MTQTNGGSAEDLTCTVRLLTVPDVARVLRCSERKAWGLIKRGRLPAVKIDRHVRITPRDLETFISQCREVV